MGDRLFNFIAIGLVVILFIVIGFAGYSTLTRPRGATVTLTCPNGSVVVKTLQNGTVECPKPK